VIGAELHLEVKTVLWQATATWQEGSDSVAGNGDVPPSPVSRARRSAFPAGFRVSRSQGSLPNQNLGCSMHQAMSPLVQPGLHNSPLLFLSKPGLLRHLGESLFKTAKANTYYNSNSK